MNNIVERIQVQIPEGWATIWQHTKLNVNLFTYKELGKVQPFTTKWIKDGALVTLEARDGDRLVGENEFYKACYMALTNKKTPMVTSKRISRHVRPTPLGMYVEALNIKYIMPDDPEFATWDGSGLIRSALVERLVQDAKSRFSKKKHNQWVVRIQGKRFEFNYANDKGQFKGHCIEVKDLEYDMVIPFDPKSEITLDGIEWIDLNPVHSSDTLNMDKQSIINLLAIISPEYVAECLWAWVEIFKAQVKDGTINDILMSSSEDANWLPQRLIPHGFGSLPGVLSRIVGQRINQAKSMRDNLTVPVHGGRYYIVADSVATWVTVARGECVIDPYTSSIIVSKHDYVEIMGILGGGDGDDGICFLPNKNGYVVCFRQPNQQGEWVVLKLAADSHIINNPLPVLDNDFSQLPTRIDILKREHPEMFINLIKDTPKKTYKTWFEAVDDAMRTALENAGVLGLYCNLLMVVAAGGNTFRYMQLLEAVIDNAVKIGGILKPVKDWTNEAFRMGVDLATEGKFMIDEAIAFKISGAVQLEDGEWYQKREGNTLVKIVTFKGKLSQIKSTWDRIIAYLEGFRTEVRKGAKVPAWLVDIDPKAGIQEHDQYFSAVIKPMIGQLKDEAKQEELINKYFISLSDYLGSMDKEIRHQYILSMFSYGYRLESKSDDKCFNPLIEDWAVEALIENKPESDVEQICVNFPWFNIGKAIGIIKADKIKDVDKKFSDSLKRTDSPTSKWLIENANGLLTINEELIDGNIRHAVFLNGIKIGITQKAYSGGTIAHGKIIKIDPIRDGNLSIHFTK